MSEGLLNQLVCSTQTRQWLQLLAALESGEEVARSELMALLSLNRRGLARVLETLAEYFGESLVLRSTSETILLRLRKPLTYRSKKQELLSEEPLLRMIHHCFLGMNSTRKEWEAAFALSLAQFYQQRKQMNAVLHTYQLRLSLKELKIVGPEAQVRQFFYEVYFQLPLLPIWMEAAKQPLSQSLPQIEKGVAWPINDRLVQQWQVIFMQRNRLGYELPGSHSATVLEVSRLLVGTPPQGGEYSIHELAALCFLCLDKNALFSPEWQTKFLQVFPLSVQDHQFKEELRQHYEVPSTVAEMMGAIARLWIQLFDWQQLVTPVGGAETSLSKKAHFFLAEWAQAYPQSKQKEGKIFCQFDLQGPGVLKEWIKEKVMDVWPTLGITAISFLQSSMQGTPPLLVVVTNHGQSQEAPAGLALSLSDYPTEQEVVSGCTKLSLSIRAGAR